VVRRQHGVIARWQLLTLGWTPKAIEHRVARGRLYVVWPGVYSVGRPDVSRYGRWMAATLRGGDGAALSHRSAAMLWALTPHLPISVHVSVLRGHPEGAGIVVHRRKAFQATRHHNIPVTTPVQTLVDIAPSIPRDDLEHAINEADKRRLVDPERLRTAIDELPRTPGIAIVRATLDHRTFTLTDSKLERLLIPIALRVGLPKPLTRRKVCGYRVDFFWPDLRLIVETDGLTYHRTPAEQAQNAVRDQVHIAAGYTVVRFTRAQVKYEPAYVESILRDVAARLSAAAPAA
jgi:very-short-patch-repair endonuclease